MKNRIAFAMIMGVITTGIITFTLIAVNVGFTDAFIKIWFRSWGMAYIVVIPVILMLGPRIQKLVDNILNEKEE